MLASDNEAATHMVYPARDAERSEHTIRDFHKGDPRSRMQTHGEPLLHEERLSPIGVFDSGAGGLTILSALRQVLPDETYIYYGDTAHCPYGTRSEADISALSLQASQFLIERGAKLIVVACNTASQAALNTLRSTFSIPFVGVVPAIKPAARATRNGRVGIAATNRAVKAAYLRQLIDEFAADIQVHAVGCPELVTLVEHGELDSSVVDETLRLAFQPLLDKDVDVIVLGCTHFPALRPAIERVVGKQICVIDSGAAIARRTRSVLDASGLLHPTCNTRGELQIWCSGDPDAFSQVASKVLGYPVIAYRSTQ